MPYTPILATLGYLLSPDGRQVLLVHRNRRPDDAHFGKYNGLGGKLEPGEDVVACLRREVREESGLECEELRLCGTISWPGFGKQRRGLVRLRLPRGPLEPGRRAPKTRKAIWYGWISERVLELPLWEGDRHFLPLVFDRDGRQFHGVMPYRDGRPVSWTYSVL